MNQSQLTSGAAQQLSIVNIRPYGAFFSDLTTIANTNDNATIWFSPSASQAIFSRIPEGKRLISSQFYYFI
jgi:hypothetical protein